MGSETENGDLEVKEAHTRTRSKQKQDREEESSHTNHDETADKSSGGKVTPSKKNRDKKSSRASEAQNGVSESDETTEGRKSKKNKHGKRMASEKNSSSNEINPKDCTPKRAKKDSTTSADKKDDSNVEEANDGTKKPKKPSKRQLKREKAEQREFMKKEASRLEATEKALNYVSKWKHARSEWKFEKLRQIWLMDNLLDDSVIPDDIFSTVLEYFEGCKGMAREQLLKKGMDVIRKQEENEETTTTEDVERSIEYKRARQLLQALPTET